MILEALLEKTGSDITLLRSTKDGRLKVSLVDATDGTGLPVDSLPQSLTYNDEGRLVAVSVLYEGVEYVQSLTYDAEGRLSSVSAWEAQS